MKFRFFNRNHSQTKFVNLNTKNCQACWKCIEKCSKDVIGKVDFLGHKHVLLINGDNCVGCFACIKVCKNNALTSNVQ